MKQLIYIFVGCLIAGTLSAQSVNLKGKTISICDDGAEWPPYTYYERVNGKKTEELVGYSVDVIREIFTKYGIKFTLAIIPWQRCQNEVDIGTKYQMFLSGGLTPGRIKRYHISQPYYFTNSYYFWSKKNHPNGLDISNKSVKAALWDLMNKYKMGSLIGYGMGRTKSLGLDTSKVDTGAKDYKALKGKILKGRVDNFQESMEVLSGLAAIGATDIVNDPDIAYAPLPGTTPRGYQMMFTKQQKIGLQLRDLVDREITQMRAIGRLDELMKKYIKGSQPIFN
jgi:polar amino acid transport system substrate-binding protein